MPNVVKVKGQKCGSESQGGRSAGATCPGGGSEEFSPAAALRRPPRRSRHKIAGAASQKPLALVLAVALLVAGILLLVYRVKKTTRQEEVYVTQTMICTNPDCGRFFQIKVPASKPFPEEICPYCKQRTAYRAVKCRACGGIFALKTEGGKRPSYVLLCPHCGSDNIDMDSSKIPVEEEE